MSTGSVILKVPASTVLPANVTTGMLVPAWPGSGSLTS
jgi:hypothetical protein